MEVVGLIPAAGKARRISPLPCSKEIFPIGFHPPSHDLGRRPKVVSHFLLEKMRYANIHKAFIVIRDGKWDIPAYYKHGGLVNMQLAYLLMDLPFGVPYSVDQAYPFVRQTMVAFGFPDIVFQPDDAFIQLVARQEKTDADLVLGILPAPESHKVDMLDLDSHGNLRGVCIRPVQTDLQYTWVIALWTPAFTSFLHKYVETVKPMAQSKGSVSDGHDIGELTMGDVIQAAIDQGMATDTVLFPDNHFVDIGTPVDMEKIRSIGLV